MDGHVATTFRGFLLDSPKIWGLQVKALAPPSTEEDAMSREIGCEWSLSEGPLAGTGIGLLAPELNGQAGLATLPGWSFR